MKLEKRRQFIINFLYFAIILGVVILLARYALGVLAPFFIALAVAFLLTPAVQYCNAKLHIHRSIAGLALVILFYALLGLLLIVLGVQLFDAAKTFFLSLPSFYTSTVAPWMNELFASIQTFAEKLDPDTAVAYNALASNVTISLGETISGISKQVVSQVTSITLKTPRFLLNLLITVIATVFLTIDFPRIKAFVMRQLSVRASDLIHNARVQLGRTLWSYTRSYAMILTITFSELALGLSIIGANNALGIAVLIALFDILPVVGSGIVLLPWSVISIVSGDLPTGIGLAVLYVVVLVVRQIMEPKIVGDRVSLHPIVTLMSMVLGTYLFGGIGLLGLPITLALLHALNKQGAIHLYKLGDDNPQAAAPSAEAASAQDEAAPAQADKKQKRPKKKS